VCLVRAGNLAPLVRPAGSTSRIFDIGGSVEFVTVGKVADFQEKVLRMFKVDGREVAVVRVDGRFHAFSNYCSHAWAPLHFGWIAGCEVVCASHGAHFNIETGESPGSMGYPAIPVYATRVEGEDVQVERPAPPDGGRPEHLRFVSVRDDV
jgi:nitrite reductase/ring-hydroxylating ferredoxin subunit